MSHDLKSPSSPISVKVFQTPPPHCATLTSSVISLSLSCSLPLQWMYIVPLVLFLMMSGAQDQSGGGAGGGAANGGGR